MKKLTSFFVLVVFLLTCVMPPQGFAQSLTAMGLMVEPGTQVALTPMFTPSHLKGMRIDPNDPFKFDFIIYRGDENLTADQKQVEYPKLIKYFLAALAVPDTDQWVNLSPYEQERIVPDNFGLTEMGRDLLAQDYLLKQIASSLTNPDTDLGKKFWDAVYAQAYQKFGTTDIPTDTFNKVWITPDKAVVYEKGNTVYMVENHLKVMLESDYKAMKENGAIGEGDDTAQISKAVMREIIIPAIEKEVNEGENFSPLRQVYSGMLLATWYKRSLKGSILGKLYADQGKVNGVNQDPRNNEEIYGQYVKAFQMGVFNMIKEDVDRYSQEIIPRKYFSGGTEGYDDAEIIKADAAEGMKAVDQDAPKLDAARTSFQNVTGIAGAFDQQQQRRSNRMALSQRYAQLSGFKMLFEKEWALYLKEDPGADVISALDLVMGMEAEIARLEAEIQFQHSEKALELKKELADRRGALKALLERDKPNTSYEDFTNRIVAIKEQRLYVGDIEAEVALMPQAVNSLADALQEIIRTLKFVGAAQEVRGYLARPGQISLRVDEWIERISKKDYETKDTARKLIDEINVFFDAILKWQRPPEISSQSWQQPAKERRFNMIEQQKEIAGQAIKRLENVRSQLDSAQNEEVKKVTREVDMNERDFRNESAFIKYMVGRAFDEPAWRYQGKYVTETNAMSFAMEFNAGVLEISMHPLKFKADKLRSALQTYPTVFQQLVAATVYIKNIMDERKGLTGRHIDIKIKGTINGLQSITEDTLTDNIPEAINAVKMAYNEANRKANERNSKARQKAVLAQAADRANGALESAKEYVRSFDVKGLRGKLLLEGLEEVKGALEKEDLMSAREVYELKLKDVHLPDLYNKDFKALKVIFDNADAGEMKNSRYGGIDMSQSSLDMQIRRDGAGVPLPVSQQDLENIRIEGLVPVILDIKPATSVALFN